MNWVVRYSINFFVLLLAQMLFLNKFNLFGSMAHINILPFVFLAAPLTANRVQLIAMAFVSGLLADSFDGTYGLYTFSMSVGAYITPLYGKFLFSKEEVDVNKSGIRDFVMVRALLFAMVPTLVFMLCLYNITHFSFSGFFLFQLKALISTILSVIFMALIMLLFPNKKQKRR